MDLNPLSQNKERITGTEFGDQKRFQEQNQAEQKFRTQRKEDITEVIDPIITGLSDIAAYAEIVADFFASSSVKNISVLQTSIDVIKDAIVSNVSGNAPSVSSRSNNTTVEAIASSSTSTQSFADELIKSIYNLTDVTAEIREIVKAKLGSIEGESSSTGSNTTINTSKKTAEDLGDLMIALNSILPAANGLNSFATWTFRRKIKSAVNNLLSIATIIDEAAEKNNLDSAAVESFSKTADLVSDIYQRLITLGQSAGKLTAVTPVFILGSAMLTAVTGFLAMTAKFLSWIGKLSEPMNRGLESLKKTVDTFDDIADSVFDISKSIALLGVASIAIGATAIGVSKLYNVDGVADGLGVISLTVGSSIALLGLIGGIGKGLDIQGDEMKDYAMSLPILMGGIAVSSLLIAGAAWTISKMSDDVNNGLLTIGLITAGSTAILFALSKITPTTILQSVLGLGGLVLVIGLTTGIVYLIAELSKHIMNDKDIIWQGLGEMGLIFGATTAALIALGLGIAAASGPMLVAGASILALEGVILTVVGTIKTLTNSTLETNRLIGQLGGIEGFKTSIENQFSLLVLTAESAVALNEDLRSRNVNLKELSKNSRLIRKTVIESTASIGAILSVIEQMENMRYVSGYTTDGKPIYKKINTSPDRMRTFGATLASSMSAFLEELIGDNTPLLMNLDNLSDNAKRVTDALLGSKKWYASIFGGSARNGGILLVVSEILKSMEKMGNMQIITGYNSNGDPIYATLSNPDSIRTGSAALASTITGFVGTLINELEAGLTEDVIDRFTDMAILLMGGKKTDTGFKFLLWGEKTDMSNGGLLQAVALMLDLVERAGKMPVGKDFAGMGRTLATSITTFVTTLSSELENTFTDGEKAKFDKALGFMSGKNGALTAISEMMELIQESSNMVKTTGVTRRGRLLKDAMSLYEIEQHAIATAKSARSFISELYKPLDYRIDVNNVDTMNKALVKAVDTTGGAISKLNKLMTQSVSSIETDKLTKKFNDLTAAIKQFNDEMANSNKNISDLINQEFGSTEETQSQSIVDRAKEVINDLSEVNVKVPQSSRYVALDGATLKMFSMMFMELINTVKETLGNEAARDIFVDLNNNIYKGKVNF